MSRFSFNFKILTKRFPFLWKGVVLGKLMQVVKEELTECVTKVNEVYDTCWITYCPGAELDRWGEDLKLPRNYGETDAVYRARLLVAFRDIQESLVITACKNAIKATIIISPVCLEHYKDIPAWPFLWPARTYDYRHLLIASFVIGNLNFVENAGFETSDWGGDEEQSAEQHYKGIYSAKLVAAGAEIFSGKSNRISIDPATYTYTVSSWVNITSYTQGKFALRAIFYDASDVELGHKDWKELTAATSGWQKQTYTFQPSDFPTNTAKIDFRFAWLADGATQPIGTAYVDNYKFEISTSATEDWTETELSTMAVDLGNVKFAIVAIWLVENSGLGYYALKKEVA